MNQSGKSTQGKPSSSMITSIKSHTLYFVKQPMLLLNSLRRQYAWPSSHWFATLTMVIGLSGMVSSVLGQPIQATEDAVKTAIQDGQLDRAMKLVQQERKIAPDNVHWYFLEGVIQAQMGQRDSAIEIFTKITISHPDQSEAYNNLGVLYASKGQLEKSKSFLEKALQTHPSYAAAHRNLSDIHGRLAQKNYAKALQIPLTEKSNPPQLTLLGRIGKDSESQIVGAKQTSTTGSITPSLPKETATAIAPVPSVAIAAKPANANLDKNSSEYGNQDKIKVENAVMNWAQAWSNKDMAKYYAAYASNFVPAGRQSRTQWENDRRLKIETKKTIFVDIKQLRIIFNGEKAIAKFQQIYTSDNFKGNSPKTLEMVRQGNNWLIVREMVN